MNEECLGCSCILQRARWRRACTSYVFLSHHAARAIRKPIGDPQITPSNRSRTDYDSNSTNQTKFTQTRRQTDISYKQRRKSYKYRIFIQTWRISLHSNELRGASSRQHGYIIPGLNGRPPIDLCSSCPAARSPDCREPRRYMLQRKGRLASPLPN